MTFRLAFVTGATPDRWAGTWRERTREPIELVPVEEPAQLDGLRAGAVEMALVRLPVDREGLHLIPLYEERPVAVMDVENTLTLLEEVSSAEVAEEELDWSALPVRDAVAAVAAGSGVIVVPMSVARLHHRKDVTYRPISDRAPTTVGLAWRVDRDDDERIQRFIGIVRGRSASSSRG